MPFDIPESLSTTLEFMLMRWPLPGWETLHSFRVGGGPPEKPASHYKVGTFRPIPQFPGIEEGQKIEFRSSPVQWVRDPTETLLCHGYNAWLGSFCMQHAWPKREKKKDRVQLNSQ